MAFRIDSPSVQIGSIAVVDRKLALWFNRGLKEGKCVPIEIAPVKGIFGLFLTLYRDDKLFIVS